MAKFKPGQSGNPAGRKPGIRDRRHDLRDTLKAEAPALVKKCIAMALSGDAAAMKLLLDRCLSPIRPSAAPVQFPVGDNPTDMARGVLAAAAEGKMPPDVAATLVQAAAALVKVEELDELRRRLEALEAAHGHSADDDGDPDA